MTLLLSLLLFVFHQADGQSNLRAIIQQPTGEDLETVRERFHQSLTSEAQCKALFKFFAINPPGHAIATAYHAANTAMHAQHLVNPYDKWKAIKAAQSGFAKAVAALPANSEVRYLRLLIEANLPSFLPIEKHAEQDVAVVMNDLKALHAALRNHRFETARTFLLDNAPLSSAQRHTLRQWKP